MKDTNNVNENYDSLYEKKLGKELFKSFTRLVGRKIYKKLRPVGKALKYGINLLPLGSLTHKRQLAVKRHIKEYNPQIATYASILQNSALGLYASFSDEMLLKIAGLYLIADSLSRSTLNIFRRPTGILLLEAPRYISNAIKNYLIKIDDVREEAENRTAKKLRVVKNIHDVRQKTEPYAFLTDLNEELYGRNVNGEAETEETKKLLEEIRALRHQLRLDETS